MRIKIYQLLAGMGPAANLNELLQNLEWAIKDVLRIQKILKSKFPNFDNGHPSISINEETHHCPPKKIRKIRNTVVNDCISTQANRAHLDTISERSAKFQELLRQLYVNVQVFKELVQKALPIWINETNSIGNEKEPLLALVADGQGCSCWFSSRDKMKFKCKHYSTIHRLLNVYVCAKRIKISDGMLLNNKISPNIHTPVLELILQVSPHERIQRHIHRCIFQSIWNLLQDFYIESNEIANLSMLQLQALADVGATLLRITNSREQFVDICFAKELENMLMSDGIFGNLQTIQKILKVFVASLNSYLTSSRKDNEQMTFGLLKIMCQQKGCTQLPKKACVRHNQHQKNASDVAPLAHFGISCFIANISKWLDDRMKFTEEFSLSAEKKVAPLRPVSALFGGGKRLCYCIRSCGIPKLLSSRLGGFSLVRKNFPSHLGWLLLELLHLEKSRETPSVKVNQKMSSLDYIHWIRRCVQHSLNQMGHSDIMHECLDTVVYIYVFSRKVWNCAQSLLLLRVFDDIVHYLQKIEVKICIASTLSRFCNVIDRLWKTGHSIIKLRHALSQLCSLLNEKHNTFNVAMPTKSMTNNLSVSETQLLRNFEDRLVFLQPWTPTIVAYLQRFFKGVANCPAASFSTLNHTINEFVICTAVNSNQMLQEAPSSLMQNFHDRYKLAVQLLAHFHGTIQVQSNVSHEHQSLLQSETAAAITLHWCHRHLLRTVTDINMFDTVEDVVESRLCHQVVKVCIKAFEPETSLATWIEIVRQCMGFKCVSLLSSLKETQNMQDFEPSDGIHPVEMQTCVFVPHKGVPLPLYSSTPLRIFIASVIIRQKMGVLFRLFKVEEDLEKADSSIVEISKFMNITRFLHLLMLVGETPLLHKFVNICG